MSEPTENQQTEPTSQQTEPVTQIVSSTSTQLEAADDESLDSVENVNGCDSTTEFADAVIEPELNEETTVESTSQATDICSDSAEDTETLSTDEADKTAPPQASDTEGTPKTSRELKSILALSKEAKLDTNLTNRRKTLEKVKDGSAKKSKITGFPVTAESELESIEVKVEEKSKEKVTKKRKSTPSENVIEGATSDDSRKSHQGFSSDIVMLKPNKDIFCWRCHHDGVQITCETCPRAYHLKCLKLTITDTEHWPCPECVATLKAENTQSRSKAMRGMTLEHLCSLLKFAVKRMIQCNGSEPFIHPVDEKQFPEYRNYIIQPMTLTMLENNIKDNLYGSTQAFEADAKWIVHNSIIFNSYQSKLTSAAKTIVKICKQEMAEIENCPSCYLNANTKKHTWFVEVCPKPHLLVWAKLKGFPYWPAKVMSISSSGMVDVRFFGAHDKAWVSVKDCFMYSVRDPNAGKQKRNDIIECVKELELYVENLKKIYGRVNYAQFKTPLDQENQMKLLQNFLPLYGRDMKKIGRDAMKCDNVDDVLKLSKSLSKRESAKSGEDEEDDGNEGDHSCDSDSDDSDSVLSKSLPTANGSTEIVHKTPTEMTRIDYHDTPTDKSKLIRKPIKTIIIRKRFSTGDMPVRITKIARNDRKNDTLPATTATFLHKTKDNGDTEDKNALSPKSKLKITHELIKKLEDNVETVESEESQNIDEKPSVSEDGSKEDAVSEEKVEDEKEKPPETVVESADSIPADTENVKLPGNEIKPDDCDIAESSISDEKTEETPNTDTAMEVDNSEEVNSEVAAESTTVNDAQVPEEKAQVIEATGTKRKLIEVESNDDKESNLFPPNKMVKLVPIENILQKKKDSSKVVTTKAKQLIVVNEIRMMKDDKKKSNKKTEITLKPMEIKNEVESDGDENDLQYMEAKRQYLSALNISEKQKDPIKPKAHEIRTRSKTEEKKNRTDNISKIIDNVASRSSDPLPVVNSKPDESKEIYIKSLTKMQTPKPKARKSFPTPNYSKRPLIRKIMPKPGIEDELRIVNATTFQPFNSTNNVMILPKLHYNKPPVPPSRELTSPPLLTMLPRPQIEGNKKIAEGSQNYIPQKEDEVVAAVAAAAASGVTNFPGPSARPAVPTIAVDEVVDGHPANQSLDAELGLLKEILPENVSKGVHEILCQPPPKLKPKPLGLLNSDVDTGVPSTAGPVAARINSMAQKLSDCFRGLLTETINDLGKNNHAEATISGLKLEIEELNHRHSIELAEIRRNVSIVLKDIQKSVIEERERIINETKANCEMEMLKKVEEAKSKQWCANCFKEAQFYCCWNTSYCDYPCQQKHWPKHMSKCTQNANQNQTQTTPSRPANQQLVLTPTSAPKFGTLFAKPQKVYLKRANAPFKQSPGGHITLVESTPGNFELLGSGPISVNGKILASTSVIEKIKSGNIVTVTAPSNSNSTQLTSANQIVTITSKMPVVSKSTVCSSDGEH